MKTSVTIYRTLYFDLSMTLEKHRYRFFAGPRTNIFTKIFHLFYDFCHNFFAKSPKTKKSHTLILLNVEAPPSSHSSLEKRKMLKKTVGRTDLSFQTHDITKLPAWFCASKIFRESRTWRRLFSSKFFFLHQSLHRVQTKKVLFFKRQPDIQNHIFPELLA